MNFYVVTCRQIYERNGIKGLFRGMSSTIYREIPGYGAQVMATP